MAMWQAGTVASHPQQKERQLEEQVHRNLYQHALLRVHQAHYQPELQKRAALLQARLQSASALALELFNSRGSAASALLDV